MMPFTDAVKILGVTLGQHLTFNSHVQNICKSSYYHIRALKHIRSSLTLDMARTVACTPVNSHLHYVNSVLYGTSVANIAKLQRVQNALARVVSFKKRADHIHPVLENLHWLPINYHIDYKVALLVYKVRSTGSPAYLQALVSDYTPTRQLRSSNQLFLLKPPLTTEIARHAFSQVAPTIWNDLPLDSCSAETNERFRCATKIHF